MNDTNFCALFHPNEHKGSEVMVWMTHQENWFTVLHELSLVFCLDNTYKLF